MKEYSLAGTKRAENGKKAAKQLRAQGLIPCNLIYTSQVFAVKLNIEGAECLAIVKEAQFAPVNEEILHLDLQKFEANEAISVAIPVKLEGFAEGVKAGGKLVKQVRSLTVKGLYTDIPERLIVDVTSIELGKTLNVASLKYDNLEILTAPSVIVAAVKATRASRQSNA